MTTVGIARTGSWSDTGVGTTPWAALTGSGPGGVPGAGDAVLGATSTNTLTIDGAQSIGTNGPNAPAAAPTVSASAGGTPTNLPTGNYYVRLVAVNANGESSCSTESSILTLTNGVSTPRIVLPALPAGGSTWSVYITNTNTGSGGITHRRYATGLSAGNFEPVSASWENGTVAFASAQLLTPASGIWGVGVFNLAAGAGLTAAGDLVANNTTGTTLGAGSTLTFSVPASQSFYWAGSITNGSVVPLICSGSSGSRVTITKTGAGLAALTGFPLSPNGSGFVQAQFADFSNLGSASANAINGKCYTFGTMFNMDDCTVNNCGMVVITANNQNNMQYRFLRTRVTNSLGTYSLDIDNSIAYVSGTKQIKNTTTDKAIRCSNGALGCDYQDNYFPGAIVMSGPVVGRSWTTMRRNLYGRTESAGSVISTAYSVTDCICYVFDSGIGNPHPFDPSAVNEDCTWSGNVFDGLVMNYDGDWLLPTTTTPANPYTLTITGNLYLPNILGDNIGTPITCYGNSKLKVTFRGNTFTMGRQGVSFGESGGYTGYVGMWNQPYNNLAWNPSVPPLGGFLFWDGLGTAYDAVAGSVTTPDYNGKWNFGTSWATAGYDATSLARGYLTGSSGGANYAFTAGTTPGDHDVNADPQFVDHKRSLVMFDQGYLGKPVGTAWASGTSYVIGDIVSVTTSGVWFGQTVNMRCIKDHPSTATGVTGKPGNGTGASPVRWSDYWEPASCYWMRESLLAGTTYDGTPLGGSSGVSIVEIARLWIRAGWAPTNTAYQNTGFGGVTIGAVPFYSAPSVSTRRGRVHPLGLI